MMHKEIFFIFLFFLTSGQLRETMYSVKKNKIKQCLVWSEYKLDVALHSVL